MRKILLTMASVAVIAIGVGAISAPASAFLDTECNGRASCSDNSTTNTTNNQGGAGGDGGSAIQGQAQGIFGSGNSENDNDNRNYNTNFNTNRNTNQQGQLQGQGQGQGQGQLQGNIGLGSGNVTNVTIGGDEAEEIPVSSAYAAPLTSADDTCMGSTSAGVQALGFGISLGSTWRDEDCVRRKDARMFYNMKMTNIALARMCQKGDNRAAVEAAGHVCPGTEASATTPVATPVAAAETNISHRNYLQTRDRD